MTTDTPASAATKVTNRGEKHTCAECACKYYDLAGAVTACPSCGTKTPAVKVRQPRAAPMGRTRARFGSFH